jgi:hypothetical protein
VAAWATLSPGVARGWYEGGAPPLCDYDGELQHFAGDVAGILER